MARCASERRAEGEVNSYRNAAGIGRTIFNRGGSFCLLAVAVGSKRTLILPLYQSARLGVTVQWTVTLVRVEPGESGAAPPVAEAASRFKEVSQWPRHECGRALADTTRSAGAASWQWTRLSVGQYPTGWSFCLISSNVRSGGAGEGVFCRAAVGLRTMVGNGIQNVCWVGQKFLEILPN